MAKLEKETLFIVMPDGWDIAFRFYADWETEKSFGKRGTTIKYVRHTGSTGEMYRKDSCKWVKITNEKQAKELMSKLNKSKEIIDEYKNKIMIEKEKMRNYFEEFS